MFDIHSDLERVILRLEKNIISEDYKGYDPFDGLMSPLFKLPFLKTNKQIRFLWQQLFKRIPFNLRPLMGINKGLNPVTLGLSIQAYTYLSQIYTEKKDYYLNEINNCISKIIALRSKSNSFYCWGYDFDWESRYSTFPAFTPTIVATGFITNALFEHYKITKNELSFALCKSASDFIRNDLNKSYNGELFCYSYSPIDHQKVLNASMKGVRLLCQVYSITKENDLLNEARKAVEYVIKFQRADGSWTYSSVDARTWVDNFHTAYILDCLDSYIQITGDHDFIGSLNIGIKYYINNFFHDNQVPKYYDKKVYPIDSTAAAQSIITLTRFGFLDLASNVTVWAIENMMNDRGCFYYQKNKNFTNRISYIRWSNAWMFLALSSQLYQLVKNDLD